MVSLKGFPGIYVIAVVPFALPGMWRWECHAPPREWDMKSQQQRIKESTFPLTSDSLCNSSYQEMGSQRGGGFRDFQHTQVALFHVALLLPCSKPFKDPLVLQGLSRAPSFLLHCLLPLPLCLSLHPTLQPVYHAPAISPLLTCALATPCTWNAFPALPHTKNYHIWYQVITLLQRLVCCTHSTDEETAV